MTAIEYLLNELPHLDSELLRPIITQAKAMEKEYLKDFYFGGCSEMYATEKKFNEYYDFTFEKTDR